jgi:hypothetical protein
VQILLQAKRFGDAKTQTEKVLEDAIHRRSTTFLGIILSFWMDKGMNPDRRYPELPVRAADGILKIDGEDSASANAVAAKAYYFAGDKAKGSAYKAKALDLSRDARERAGIEQALRGYE